MLRKACIVIAAFFFFGKILLYSQTADSVITSLDFHDTWGTGPGVADYISSANYHSNAVAALSSAWAGASAAGAYLYKDIFLDLDKPSIVKVRVTYTFLGGTVNYGFGSFSSISAIVGANGVNYQRDIDPAFGPDDIVDKLVSLVGLLGFYPTAAASSVGMLIEIVDIFGDIMEYMNLAQYLMEMNDTEIFTTTFRFKYDPGIVNRIKVGVRANAAGALTGSATAIIAGQVEKIELYLRQGDGSWVKTNPSATHQWVQEEISGFEEGYQWYDRRLDDISQNDHKGTYHPYTVVPGNGNYYYRHDYSMYDYMEHLILNSPYSSYTGADDEFISLNYNASDLRTLQRGGTFETWVKPEGSDYTRGHIIYLGDKSGGDGLGDHGEIHLSTNPDGRFEFYMGDDDQSLHIRTDTSFITLNEWHHVLVSYLNIDNTMEANLYVNGQEVASGRKSGTIDPGLQQAYLGKPDANTRYFHGRLKGIHIRQESYGPEKALMAYYSSGGDVTPPETPQIEGIPSLYAGNAVTVHWNTVTDDKSGVEKYRVSCYDQMNPLKDRDTTLYINYVLFDSLQNGHEYEFRVQAVDSAGNKSGWSEIVSTMIDTVAPGTPVIFPEPEYTPTDSNTISWEPVSDNMDSVVYFVEICNTPEFNPYDSVNTTFYDTSHTWIKETHYTFKNLEHDQTRYYRVISRDLAGNRSAWSNTVHTTQDYDKPYPPVLNPEPEYSAGDQNHVSWSPPPGDWSFLDYKIIASFSPDPDDQYTSAIARGTDTTLYNLSHEDDFTCYFFVKARNEYGVWSNWSEVEITIQDFDIPEKPLVDPLPASVSTCTITIPFHDDDPTNTLTDLTHQLRYADNRAFDDAVIMNIDDTYEPVFHFRTSDRRLYFQIRGIHDGHIGEWSEMVYTTYSPPADHHDTYHVSSDGNDNISPNKALTPDDPTFKSISKAFEYTQPGDTIKVMPGKYAEYMIIDKPITIMAYSREDNPPVMTNLYNHPYVFQVQADQINLFGFQFDVEVFTSNNETIIPILVEQSQSCWIWDNVFLNNPVKLVNAKNVTLQGNQFYSSTGGIIAENSDQNRILNNSFQDGASLALNQSSSNTIHDNYFYTYGNEGILLSGSDLNTLTENTFQYYEDYWIGELTCGIRIIENSLYNNISANDFSAYIDKPLILDNSSYNLITSTSFTDHYGDNIKIYLNNSHSNTLYDNHFYDRSNHDELCISEMNSVNQWHSYTKINYYPENTPYSEKDTIYNVYQSVEKNLEAWWLGDNTLNKNDMSQPGKTDTLSPGRSEIWTVSNAAEEEMIFVSQEPEEKRWEGCLYFENTPGGTDSLKLELGTANDPWGNGYTADGPSRIITGTDTSHLIMFDLDTADLIIPAGNHLSLRITNLGPSEQRIMTGGSRSYITSPLSNQPPEIETLNLTVHEDDTLYVSRDTLIHSIYDPDNPDSTLVITLSGVDDVTVEDLENAYRIIPEKDLDCDRLLSVRVSDGEFTTESSLLLNIIPVNDAPVIDSLPRIVIDEGQDTTLHINTLKEYVHDVDSPLRDIECSLQSDVIFINREYFGTNEIYFTIYSDWFQNDPGEYPATFIVTDGEKSDSAGFIITVKNVNNETPSIDHYISFKENEMLFQSVEDLGLYFNDGDVFNENSNQLCVPDSVIMLDTVANDPEDNIFQLTFSGGENVEFELVNSDTVDFMVYSNIQHYNGWDTLDVTIHDYYGEPHRQVSLKLPVWVIPVNDPPFIAELPVLEWEEDDTLKHFPVSTLYDRFSDDNPVNDIRFMITGGHQTEVYSYWNSTVPVELSDYNEYLPYGSDLSLNFTSAENWFGTDTLLLSIHDNQGSNPEYATANLIVDVQPVNDKPDISDQYRLNFFENDTLTCNLSLLENRNYDVETCNDSLEYDFIAGNTMDVQVQSHRAVFIPPPHWHGVDTLPLIVSDGELADTAQVLIEVYPVNTPPEISSIPAISFPEDSSIAYHKSMWYDYVSDQETPVEDLSYSISGGSHVYEGYNVIQSSWNWFGTDTITLIVTDESNRYNYRYSDTSYYMPPNTVSRDIIIHVTPVNDPPEFKTTLPAIEFFENDSCLVPHSYFYDIVSDVETADEDLSYSVHSGKNIYVSVKDDTSFIFKSRADWSGTEYLNVIVSDGVDHASETVRVTVINVIDSLIISGPDSVWATEDELFQADIEFEADKSTDVYFYLSEPLLWMDVDGNQLVGRPTEGIEGDYQVQLVGSQATIPSIEDTLTVNLHVTPVNDSPYLYGSDSVSANRGGSFSYTIRADDPDDSHLIYEVTEMPSWMSVDSIDVSGEIPDDAEDTSFVTIVSDGELADTARVTVCFEDVPMLPVVASPKDIHGAEDQYFSYVFSAYDPAGGFPMTDYLYLPDWLTENQDTLTGYPPKGVDKDSIRVAMYSMDADTVTLYIHLEPYNSAPYFISPKIVKAKEDSMFSYTVQAVDPEDSTVTCTISDVPFWATVQDDSIFGIPPEGILEDHFMAFASDGEEENSQYVLIEIETVNDKPFFTSPDSISVEENGLLEYSLAAADPEDSTLAYSYMSFPVWADTNEIHISGIPPKHSPDTSITAMVSDGELADTIHIAVRILPVNAPPVFPTLSDTIYCTEDLLTRYVPHADDPDGDDLTYKIDAGYHWIQLQNDTVTIQPEEGVLESTCDIFASDGEYRDTLELKMIITPVNDPPYFVSDSMLHVTDNGIFKYTPMAVDPEDSLVTCFFDDLPIWLNVDETGQAIEGKPYTGASDTSFVVYATDGELSDTLHVQLTVEAVNEAPEITAPGVLYAMEGEYFSFTVESRDPEEDVLTHTFIHPEWLTAESDSLFGYPPNGITADSFSVVVSDGALTDSVTCSIQITPVNDPPVFQLKGDTLYTSEHDSLIHTFTVVDPDDSTLTFIYETYPDWIRHEDNKIYGYAGEGDQSGEMYVTVSDGEKSDTARVYLQVEHINDAPWFTSPDTIRTVEKETFVHRVKATDPEDSTVYISFQDVPSWIDTASNIISGTPFNGYTADSLLAVVTDGFLQDTQQIFITVEPVNDAPLILSPDSVQAVEKELFTYRISAVDSENVALSFSVDDLPGWLGFDEQDTLISGIPDDNSRDAAFRVLASDGEKADTLTVWLSVLHVNDPPSIISPAVFQATEGKSFSWKPDITDPDDSVFTYVYKDYPSWCSVSGSEISGRPPEGVLDFTFTSIVSDGEFSDSIDIDVSVTPVNQAPVILSDRRLYLDEHEAFVFAPQAEDPEDSTLVFTFKEAPSWMQVDDTSLFGVVPEGAGDTSALVIVSDGELRDSLTLDIFVLPVNDPPFFTSDSFVETPEKSSFVYHFSAEDPEDSTLTFIVSTLPDWLSVDGDSLSGETPVGPDTAFCRIRVSDGELRDTLDVQIVVLDINESPVITSADSVVAVENEDFVYQPEGYDPDSTDITFTIKNLPSWLDFTSNQVTGVAGEGTTDTTFMLIAEEITGTLADTLIVFVDFVPVNKPPVFLTDFPDTIHFFQNDTFRVALQEWEPYIYDDDSLKYIQWSVPQRRIYSNFRADSLLLYAPHRWAGMEQVKIVVEDREGLSDTTELCVIVESVNDPPFITECVDTTIFEDEIFTRSLDILDFDGDELLVGTTTSDTAVTVNYDESILTITPDQNWNGSVQITISASDQDTTVKEDFYVTVVAVNDPPVIIRPLPDVSVDEDHFGAVIIPRLEDHFGDVDRGDVLTFRGEALTPGLDSLRIVPLHTMDRSLWQNVVYGSQPRLVIKRDKEYSGPASEVLRIPGKKRTSRNVNSSVQNKSLPVYSGVFHKGLMDTTLVIAYPSENFNGDVELSISASDTSGEAVTDTMTLQIIPINDPPVLQTLADTTVREDHTLSLPLIATDDDNDSLSFSAESDTTGVLAEVTDTILTLIPAPDWYGTATVQVNVRDQDTLVSETFVLTVLPVNDPPVISFLPDTSLFEDDTLSMPLTVYDIDDDTIQVIVEPAESAVYTAYEDSQLTLIPDPDWNGITEITATATDQDTSVNTSFQLTVIPVNDPPILSESLQDVSIDEDHFGAVIIPRLEDHFEDVDQGDVLSFKGEALTPGLDSLRIVPIHEIDQSKWTKIVAKGRPLLVFRRKASSQTPDRDVMIFPEKGKPGRISSTNTSVSSLPVKSHITHKKGSDTTLVVVYPAENFFGDVPVTLTAVDTSGESIADTLMLQILPVNDPPVFSAVPDTSFLEDENLFLPLNYLCSFVEDPDTPDSLLHFSLMDTQLVKVDLKGDSLRLFADPDQFGKDTLLVIVDDGEYKDSTSFIITIHPVNDPPVFTELFPDSLRFQSDETDTLKLEGLFTDVDTPDSLLVLSYVYSRFVQFNIIDSLQILTVFTEENQGGLDTLVLSVSDGELETLDSIVVRVEKLTEIDYFLAQIPRTYELYQNYPNPFNSRTQIMYGIPYTSDVEIRIYDITGREVVRLIQKEQPPKNYQITWDGRNHQGVPVSSGIYLYRIIATSEEKTFMKVKKLMLLK